MDASKAPDAAGRDGADDSESAAPRLRCNTCFRAVEGACFRTKCDHLFCSECSYRQWDRPGAASCPSCGTALADRTHIHELFVAPPGSMHDAHTDVLLLSRILTEPLDVMATVEEAVRFWHKQLHLQTTHEADAGRELLAKAEVAAASYAKRLEEMQARLRGLEDRHAMLLRELSTEKRKRAEVEVALRDRFRQQQKLQEMYLRAKNAGAGMQGHGYGGSGDERGGDGRGEHAPVRRGSGGGRPIYGSRDGSGGGMGAHGRGSAARGRLGSAEGGSYGGHGHALVAAPASHVGGGMRLERPGYHSDSGGDAAMRPSSATGTGAHDTGRDPRRYMRNSSGGYFDAAGHATGGPGPVREASPSGLTPRGQSLSPPPGRGGGSSGGGAPGPPPGAAASPVFFRPYVGEPRYRPSGMRSGHGAPGHHGGGRLMRPITPAPTRSMMPH